MIVNNKFMQKAIELGVNAMREGTGGPFGAIVVRDDKIVGQGQNRVLERCDPTAHAEMEAIRDACEGMKSFELKDCDIYSSCEPCPMCLGAVYWSRLKNIYYAANRADAAAIGFDDYLFYEEFDKNHGERRISMVEINRREALAVFDQWRSKDPKRMY